MISREHGQMRRTCCRRRIALRIAPAKCCSRRPGKTKGMEIWAGFHGILSHFGIHAYISEARVSVQFVLGISQLAQSL